MTPLAALLCGHDQCEGIAKVALGQLRVSIEKFGERVMAFLQEDPSEELLTFGPFCTRVLLENGCAALVGRFDTFRLLYLSEFQSQPEYEPGKRARSAFSWSGDVMPEDKVPPLWNIDADTLKINRALFSQHLEHVYWRPAFNSMLDFVSKQSGESTLTDVLAIDPENFIRQTKGRLAQLYSMLSKGVHWEFFTSALLFDDATIKTAIRDTCLLVAQLGLASHFVPTAYASLEPKKAVEAYVAFIENYLTA